MTSKRLVAFIPIDGFVEGRGYRVAFVTEGEAGYSPTGTWPYTGAVGEKMPWFWGPTYDEARAHAIEYNARMGISEADANDVVIRSVFGGRR